MGTELVPVRVLSGRTLAAEIDAEVQRAVAGEVSVSRSYARLAHLLMLFKLNEGWRETGHASFNAYLLTLKERYDRSQQQLYAYVMVAEKLLPKVGESGLEQMGVTKGMELCRAAKHARKDITPELIEAALLDANGVAEIRALAHKVYELGANDLPRGKYLDLGGFYLDDEQRQTFNDACRISIRVLGLPPEMPDWQKRQRIILFWAQEINGTYAAEAFGMENPPEEPREQS